MSLRQSTPGEGGASLRVHFRYVGVAPNKTWPAHVAGPAMWFQCHTSERTKPCLHWMTNGELGCPRCKGTDETKELGYQPLYRSSDGCPVMVVLYADQREHADKLAHHERAIVGREGEKGDAVYIRRAFEQTPKYQSSLMVRMVPADLTETLLIMWKIPELVEWYRRQPKQSDNAVSLPTGVAVRPDGKPYSPMMQAAAKRHGADVLPIPETTATFDEAYARMEQRKAQADKPSTNGHTKPKG